MGIAGIESLHQGHRSARRSGWVVHLDQPLEPLYCHARMNGRQCWSRSVPTLLIKEGGLAIVDGIIELQRASAEQSTEPT